MRPASAGPPSSPNPPASSAGVRPRGSSSNASGLPRVSATIRSRTRSSSGPATDGLQQRLRFVVGQPSDHELRQTLEMALAGRLAHREHQPDRLRAQTARHERQHLRRRAVEPLRIVDDADQRPVLGRVRQQAQDRQADEEAIRGVAVAQAERGAERLALRVGEAVQAIDERRAELMQPREGELHLGLDARRPRDAEPRRAPHQILEQGALAHAGLAAQHQRAAQTLAHARDELIQRRALAAPAEQLRLMSRHGHPPRLRHPGAHVGRDRIDDLAVAGDVEVLARVQLQGAVAGHGEHERVRPDVEERRP